MSAPRPWQLNHPYVVNLVEVVRDKSYVYIIQVRRRPTLISAGVAALQRDTPTQPHSRTRPHTRRRTAGPTAHTPPAGAAQECLSGGELFEHLLAKGPFKEDYALAIFAQARPATHTPHAAHTRRPLAWA